MNIEQIVDKVHADILRKWTSAELKEFFLGPWTDGRQLIDYHPSLGRYIRIRYSLWDVPWTPELKEGIDYSPNHPDHVSMTIIEKVWKKGYNG